MGLVHIIDDDESVRDALSMLLQQAGMRTAVHPSAGSFLDASSEGEFGCVVTDVRMPGMTGIDLLRKMSEIDRVVPVIIVTGHSDVPLAVEALKSGAFDFIEKPFDADRIVETVRAALDFREKARRSEETRAEVAGRMSSLTVREREVLEGLVAGHANKVIAQNLGISPRTVEIYRANVMHKLQASSLSELVRLSFVADGLLDADAAHRAR
ncbi:response regulator FixJ [Amorphus orientalis]|uniref:Two-component system response regulator FixJ n=1 Tax=Amorphus orientalis TaxID=649198 RepID=A0AAE3VQW9_9HYPH|nr:response regulator FixJ [Amorphus orientalis]MDQ0316697.1 two-component system response regulator FixJ [Amorphus orientalis]